MGEILTTYLLNESVGLQSYKVNLQNPNRTPPLEPLQETPLAPGGSWCKAQMQACASCPWAVCWAGSVLEFSTQQHMCRNKAWGNPLTKGYLVMHFKLVHFTSLHSALFESVG